MENVAKIALGVALGLALFCGGSIFLGAMMCSNGMRDPSSATRRQRSATQPESDRGPRPEIGETGLAVSVERFIQKQQGYVPLPKNVDADPVRWDAENRTWYQIATFDLDPGYRVVGFSIAKDGGVEIFSSTTKTR